MTRTPGPRGQMSDSFLNAAFLTLSGGFQDAYTFCCRDGVFANAQTGNLVRMGCSLMTGQWRTAAHFLLPLFAFIGGFACAGAVRRRFGSLRLLHWRQLILLVEITLLLVSGFIPAGRSMPANVMISFVCALQIQAFRKVEGQAFATTMCIGNLRSGTEALCAWLAGGGRAQRRRAAAYFGGICLFVVGAGIGGVVTAALGTRAIWLSCVLLLASFCLMLRRGPEAG